MLSHDQDLAFRVAQFSVEPVPAAQIDALKAVLARFYGDEVTQTALVPHADQTGLRAALRGAAPALAELADDLVDQLESRYSSMVIPRAWLDHLDMDDRAAVLFALSMLMGRPTPTDKVDQKIVWDIRALGDRMKAGHVPTFSEHANEAELHTDTQYYAEPERLMLLYFNRPAACGGGVSYGRDIGCIKRELEKTADGRWALEVLMREELPFRIPMTFTRDGSQNAVEVTFARILGERPHVRFRIDTLKRGFQVHPERETPEVRRALDIFIAELENAERRFEAFCETDTLLALNNHECLHGRTDFTDLERHAFRIRIADDRGQDAAREQVLATA